MCNTSECFFSSYDLALKCFDDFVHGSDEYNSCSDYLRAHYSNYMNEADCDFLSSTLETQGTTPDNNGDGFTVASSIGTVTRENNNDATTSIESSTENNGMLFFWPVEIWCSV